MVSPRLPGGKLLTAGPSAWALVEAPVAGAERLALVERPRAGRLIGAEAGRRTGLSLKVAAALVGLGRQRAVSEALRTVARAVARQAGPLRVFAQPRWNAEVE